jgi:hypothetical protein
MSEEHETKFGPGEGTFQFTSLQRQDREELVELSAEAFVEVDKLELSALGANAELHGEWPDAPALIAWQDVGSYGRTVHSVTVRRGYLFPLGHRVTKTTIIQRVVAPEPDNDNNYSGYTPVAYLQTEEFIKVSEVVKSYGATGEPFAEAAGGTSDWPFTSVRMLTLVTPKIKPAGPPVTSKENRLAYWQLYGNDEVFLWRFVATDLAGHDVTFEMPLIFVEATKSGEEFKTGSGSWAEELAQKYSEAQGGSHQTWSEIGGAPMRFAPEVIVDGKPNAGATTHPTLLLELGAATSEEDPNLTAGSKLTKFQGPGAQVLEKAGQPNFYPVIVGARIRLHAADALMGKDFSDENGAPLGGRPAVGGVQFRFFGPYVAQGSSSYGVSSSVREADSGGGVRPDGSLPSLPNPGSVYAEAVKSVALNLPSAAVGALGTPNATIAGLSGAIGAVGGELKKGADGQLTSLENYAQNAAALVKEYFKGAGETLEETEKAAEAGAEEGAAALSELLGGLKLANILADTGAGSGAVRRAGVAHPEDEGGESGFQTPTISSLSDPSSGPPTVKYKLHTPLKKWPSTNAIFVPDGEPGYLTLITEVVKGLNDESPTYNVEGSIDPFSICLLGESEPEHESSTYFLKLHFESLTFTAGNGGKPSVHVNLDEVKFEGALEFVNTLEEFLESLGGEGLTVHVEPTKLTVGTSITLPPVEIGILTLSGLGFNGSVEIPFISGTAIATFGFASKENPFTLTVVMFGGGGFVAVSVGFGGVQSVELQFDFTGRFGFDIVVASGSLSLVAGIYIKYEVQEGGLFLEGFVRVTGQLEVLGIISISAELILSLSYDTKSGEAVGTATLRAHFSVFGFGASVEITMSKSFHGSGSGTEPQVRRGSSGALGSAEESVRPADKKEEEEKEKEENELTWENLMPPAAWETYAKAFSPPPADIVVH